MSGYIILLLMAISLLGGAGGTWYVKGNADKLALEAAINTQKENDNKFCAKEKQITKEANDGLQKDRDAITANLAKYQQLHPPQCIMPAITKPAAKGKHRARPTAANGISTGWLRSFAADDCAVYRAALIREYRFEDAIWALFK